MVAAFEGEDKITNTTKVEEKKDLLTKACSSLILGIGDKMMRKVVKEFTTADA